MKKSVTSKKSETDCARVDAMKDADIDLSDIPEVTPEMFERSVVRRGLKPVPRRQQASLNIDSDLLEWFRAQGEECESLINAALRDYVEGHKEQRR